MTRGGRRPARWETLGAWLRLWTPPRDVEVPPVPWRRVALAGAVLALLIGAVVALGVPAIDRAKDRAAREEARIAAERRAAQRRRLIVEQRPRRGRATGLPPPRRLSPAAELAARRDLLERLAAAVRADAAARFGAGTLRHRATRAECEGYPPGVEETRPEEDLERDRARYACLAVTADIPRGAATRTGGVIGYPFLASVDFTRRSWVFCKTNPAPAEEAIPDPRSVIRLPPECAR